jgi:hypothetical protein
MTRVTREASVQQSVQDFIGDTLRAKGYPLDTEIVMRDAFEQSEFSDGTIDHEYVALGYNFDDGGRPIEAGSNLRQYRHTIEVFVIATTAARGSNLAYAIRDALEGAERIPLKDVSQAGHPVIDVVLVDPVSAERQAIPDPDPWEEFVWLLRVPIIDEYDPTGA